MPLRLSFVFDLLTESLHSGRLPLEPLDHRRRIGGITLCHCFRPTRGRPVPPSVLERSVPQTRVPAYPSFYKTLEKKGYTKSPETKRKTRSHTLLPTHHSHLKQDTSIFPIKSDVPSRPDPWLPLFKGKVGNHDSKDIGNQRSLFHFSRNPLY